MSQTRKSIQRHLIAGSNAYENPDLLLTLVEADLAPASDEELFASLIEEMYSEDSDYERYETPESEGQELESSEAELHFEDHEYEAPKQSVSEYESTEFEQLASEESVAPTTTTADDVSELTGPEVTPKAGIDSAAPDALVQFTTLSKLL
jgi:hypothetical protein